MRINVCLKKITSLIVVAVLYLNGGPYKGFAYQADVQDLPTSNYTEQVTQEINSAKSSVHVFMYLISTSQNQSEAQTQKLLNALIDAKKRGLTVRVILDQNINFEEADDYKNKNHEAYELLRRNNIDVFFDEASTFMHAKAVIIDDETVILGSTNWSKSALTRNIEANALIRSKEFAQNLLKQLNETKIQEVPQVITPTVSIPGEFFTNKRLLGEMVTQSDQRAFDLYLFLVSEFNENNEGKLTVDYDKAAKAIGIDRMRREDYRRQLNKALAKLDAKYGLIKFTLPEGRNNDVTIKLKPNKNIDIEDVKISSGYWRFGWNKTLPFSAKVMYLINLFYAKESLAPWFMARETISKKHGISESFISDGTRELRRKNLLSVEYGDLEGKAYDQRKANVYTPKALYDPEVLKKSLEDLGDKFGKDRLDRATRAATVVFEENNPLTIKALIELEEKYGEVAIRGAAKKIFEKNPDNPKRSAGYFVSTVKALGSNKGNEFR